MANYYHGEFCNGCGISQESNWPNKEFTGLVLDKINNDKNHTIKDNKVNDFQLLCKSCNNIKNPVSKPEDPDVLQMTQSEKKNMNFEKPLIEWIIAMLNDGKKVTWDFVVSEGSQLFDGSPETIERRYYKKWFKPEAISSPVALDVDENKKTIVVFRKREKSKIALDIDPHTPTPSIPEKT